jgi:hypothetical protein
MKRLRYLPQTLASKEKPGHVIRSVILRIFAGK